MGFYTQMVWEIAPLHDGMTQLMQGCIVSGTLRFWSLFFWGGRRQHGRSYETIWVDQGWSALSGSTLIYHTFISILLIICWNGDHLWSDMFFFFNGGQSRQNHGVPHEFQPILVGFSQFARCCGRGRRGAGVHQHWMTSLPKDEDSPMKVRFIGKTAEHVNLT